MNLKDVDKKYAALSPAMKSYLQDQPNEFPFIHAFHGDLNLFHDQIEIFMSEGDAPIVLRKKAPNGTKIDVAFLAEFQKVVTETNDYLINASKTKKYDTQKIEYLKEVFHHYCYGK